MDELYPVFYGDTQIGKVQVLHQGLYAVFQAHARLPEGEIYRLWAVWDGGELNLGVMTPEEEGFSLRTRRAAKHLGAENLRFAARGRQEFQPEPKEQSQPPREAREEPKKEPQAPEGEYRFVPIVPEEPFAYISRLKDSFLATQNGQQGILLPKE